MFATPHVELTILSSKIFPDNIPSNLPPPASRARACSTRTYKISKNIAKAVSQKRLGGPFLKLSIPDSALICHPSGQRYSK